MPAWFDIESLDNLEEVWLSHVHGFPTLHVYVFQETDIEGLKASAKIVYKHIDGEIRAGIPSNKIIIGGFSQGSISCYRQRSVFIFI